MPESHTRGACGAACTARRRLLAACTGGGHGTRSEGSVEEPRLPTAAAPAQTRNLRCKEAVSHAVGSRVGWTRRGGDGVHAFAHSGWRASVVPKGESNTCCRVRVMNAVTVTERSVPVTGGLEADVAAVRLSQKGPCGPRSHRLCDCRDPLRSPIYPKSHRL